MATLKQCDKCKQILNVVTDRQACVLLWEFYGIAEANMRTDLCGDCAGRVLWFINSGQSDSDEKGEPA